MWSERSEWHTNKRPLLDKNTIKSDVSRKPKKRKRNEEERREERKEIE